VCTCLSTNNADSLAPFATSSPAIDRRDSSINAVAAGELALAGTLDDTLVGGNGGVFLPKFMMVKKVLF